MEIFLRAEIAGWTQLDDPNPFLYFKKALQELETKDYGEEFQCIGIIPVIMPEEYHDGYTERRQIWRKKREADIRLYIDYEKYIKGDSKTKLMLWTKCIVDSIEVVESRKKGDFQGEKLIQDFLDLVGVKREDLEKL